MRICSVENCNKIHWARGYCRYHVGMFYRRGEITERNRLSDNVIIKHSNYAEVILCDTYAREKARTLIDLESIKLIEKHKWYLDNQGYATTRISKNKQIRMHSLLINCKSGNETDHIDRNTLNNMVSNLRQCTHMENMWNCKIKKTNTSGYAGVYKQKDKWIARATRKYKEYWIGTFATKEEANKARINFLQTNKQ